MAMVVFRGTKAPAIASPVYLSGFTSMVAGRAGMAVGPSEILFIAAVITESANEALAIRGRSPVAMFISVDRRVCAST